MAVRPLDDKASDTLVVVSGEGFWTGSSTLPHLHQLLRARGAYAMIQADHPAGPSQVLAVYRTEDTGAGIDLSELMDNVAGDIANRAAHGWRVVSMMGLPLRQMGTAGNILFQSGGQYATDAAVAVLFARS